VAEAKASTSVIKVTSFAKARQELHNHHKAEKNQFYFRGIAFIAEAWISFFLNIFRDPFLTPECSWI
jgi:hypothetical protein